MSQPIRIGPSRVAMVQQLQQAFIDFAIAHVWKNRLTDQQREDWIRDALLNRNERDQFADAVAGKNRVEWIKDLGNLSRAVDCLVPRIRRRIVILAETSRLWSSTFTTSS